jgi:hypothetical protein
LKKDDNGCKSSADKPSDSGWHHLFPLSFFLLTAKEDDAALRIESPEAIQLRLPLKIFIFEAVLILHYPQQICKVAR